MVFNIKYQVAAIFIIVSLLSPELLHASGNDKNTFIPVKGPTTVKQWLVAGPFAGIEDKVDEHLWEKDYLKSIGGETKARPMPGDSITVNLSWDLQEKEWIGFPVKTNEVGYVGFYLASNDSNKAQIQVFSYNRLSMWSNGTNGFSQRGVSFLDPTYPPVCPDGQKITVGVNEGLNFILIKSVPMPGSQGIMVIVNPVDNPDLTLCIFKYSAQKSTGTEEEF
ncbi:MAG: hypothetical protein HY606_12875 [Planctomycetes bacterium]|nr:hypothetical protein [Planctomycetota bacterium]